MRLSHTPDKVSATFDDPDLTSHAGLIPLMRLAENAGLPDLADDMLTLPGPAGANAGAKITSIVAGMAAGADSIDDLDLLRHGALPEMFDGIRAPSTLGTHLRAYGIGHQGQLERVAARFLGRLGELTPGLLPAPGDEPIFLDVDSKITQVYGPGKEGAKYGYTKVRGLNFLAATLSGHGSPPVITGTRLRGGNADTRRKAASFVTENLTTLRRDLAVTAQVHVRLDSGFYVGKVIKAITSAGHRFSVTVPQTKPIRTAIAAIAEDAWRKITYPDPVYDGETRELITTTEIAVTSYTAFTNVTSQPGQRITADLVVRRTPITTTTAQGELFPSWRYHAVFTNDPAGPVTVEARHRGRAGAIEAVFADFEDSALAHFPSGRFMANAAWLTLAALTHNLTRAAGHHAGGVHVRARTGTLRRHLVAIAARITGLRGRPRGRVVLHLPRNWPWAQDYLALFTATTTGSPSRA